MITWIVDCHVDRLKGRETPFKTLPKEYGHTVYGLRDSVLNRPIDLTGVQPSEYTIVRGSHGFVHYVEENLKVQPGGFTHQNNFQITTYADQIGDWNLNSDYEILSYNDLLIYMEKISERIFVKPLSLKQFNGLVVERNFKESYIAKYNKWIEIPQDAQLVVCPLQEFGREYRFVVVGGKAVAWSDYQGNIDVPRDAINAAHNVAQIWGPQDVYVVDLAETVNGYKVVEYNQFSTAAMYGCSERAIIEALEESLK